MSFYFWVISQICLYQNMFKGKRMEDVRVHSLGFSITVKLLRIVAGAVCACHLCTPELHWEGWKSSLGHVVRLS